MAFLFVPIFLAGVLCIAAQTPSEGVPAEGTSIYESDIFYNLMKSGPHARKLFPGNLTVELDLKIQKIIEANAKKGIVTVQGYLTQRWYDIRLVAEREGYIGETLVIPIRNLYIPDIKLFNGQAKQLAEVDATVLPYGGIVQIVVPYRFEVLCNIRSERAETECSMRFGSWSHNAMEIDVVAINSEGDLADQEYVDGWCRTSESRAERTVQRYACCPEAFVDVSFYFTFSCGKRRLKRDVVNLASEKLTTNCLSIFSSLSPFLPTILSPFLILVAFLLPNSGERAIYSALVFSTLLIQLNTDDIDDHQEKFLKFGGVLCIITTFFALFPTIMACLSRNQPDLISKEKRKFCWARLVDGILFIVCGAALVLASISFFT